VGERGVVVLRPSNRYAVQGAVAIGVLALLAGGALSKIAFVGFLPFVVVGVWIAWRQMQWLDRWVPRVVPRGRILGALLMLVLLAISAIAVVQPARKWAKHRGDVKNAVALSVQAEAQLAAGDLAGARASVDGALQFAPQLGQVIATSQKVMVAQIQADTAAQLQGQAVARAAYERALTKADAGKWDAAIADMTAAGGYADAPAQLAVIRNLAATKQVAIAKQALAAGDAQAAFEAYGRAVAYDQGAKNPTLIKAIAKALQAGS
jgi:tetratricopeptide (TPR) repeat protein